MLLVNSGNVIHDFSPACFKHLAAIYSPPPPNVHLVQSIFLLISDVLANVCMYSTYMHTYVCALVSPTLYETIVRVKPDPPSMGGEAGTPDYFVPLIAIY